MREDGWLHLSVFPKMKSVRSAQIFIRKAAICAQKPDQSVCAFGLTYQGFMADQTHRHALHSVCRHFYTRSAQEMEDTMIELSLLAQLVAFADCGTLSATAERLHTSQPALTRSMKRLEEELHLALFVRSKNHIALTPTGEMAVHYARRVLTEAEEFEKQLAAYDRSLRTIAVGFCAPVPQMVLTPLLNTVFEGMTISADMKDDADFLDRLRDGSYQLAVTHLPPEDRDLFHAVKCGHEDLFLSLPATSPLAFYPELNLRHLRGETILILNRIGFWMDAVRAKTRETRYLLQTERDALIELGANSPYPFFQSDYFIQRGETLVGRINVPLTDAECHTDYYLVCRKEDAARYRQLFAKVREDTVA